MVSSAPREKAIDWASVRARAASFGIVFLGNTQISSPRHFRWSAVIPALFVLFWSSGFLGAKLGLSYAEPLTFLALRMALVVALLCLLAVIGRAPWPANAMTTGHNVVVGLLVHAGYLGGVFSALHLGMSVGLVALIVGLQPALTAAAASVWLNERITPLQWLGFALGLIGVGLVVGNGVMIVGVSLPAIGLAALALISITAGTLYQKRYGGGMDFRTAGVIQYTAAGVVLFLLAASTETMQITWTPQFVFALLWLCLVLSVGAIGLLYFLIRRGEASKVASLFYLTPPVTALMAFGLFGEALNGTAMVGMALTAVAVAMVVRSG